jgi:hypothetical protein
MTANRAEPSQSAWKALYVVGGVAALLTVLNGLAEIGITFLPGGGMSGGPATAVDWFSLYRSSPFLGMRNLGLLNIIFTFLSIPLTYALYGAHRRTHRAFAGLSLIAALLGAAVFLAGNRAFPMLELSSRYAAAGTEAQRSALAAAGEAMLAVGHSHTAGTFLAFFFSTLGGLGFSLVMLRAGIFSKASAILGIAGFGLLLLFEFTSDFAPGFRATFLFAAAGGPLSLAWDLLVALGLFRLARQPAALNP